MNKSIPLIVHSSRTDAKSYLSGSIKLMHSGFEGPLNVTIQQQRVRIHDGCQLSAFSFDSSTWASALCRPLLRRTRSNFWTRIVRLAALKVLAGCRSAVSLSRMLLDAAE